MKAKPYDKISIIYNGLMQHVDYNNWSRYILSIVDLHASGTKKVLELASGSCLIGDIISKKFKSLIVTDFSLSMLKSSKKNGLKKICCDMTALPFKTKFDFIFSAFDSVNYILKQKTLLTLFREVFYVLKENSIFTFDASLENNSIKFLTPKTIVGNYNGYSFQRISRYSSRSRIHYNNFIIINESGLKFKEVHKQKIHSLKTYFNLAEKAGLHIIALYKCFTFSDAGSDSDRIQFVMKRARI